MTESAFVPGRVNVIGEHTDYNDGLSLAFAIDRGVNVELRRRSDNQTWLFLEGREPCQLGHLGEHDLSVAMAEAAWKRIPRAGVELHVTSNLPADAGMSSSAAYIGALCLALGARGSILELAQLVQRCEGDVGHHVGLLDQIATLGGKESAALLINFETNSYSATSLPAHWGFTVVHSETSRQLAESGYQARRQECAEIRRIAGSWRDVTRDSLGALPEPLMSRARHVVTENQRVRDFIACTLRNDVRAAGELLNESHASLRDDFQVSTSSIDALVQHLQSLPKIFGARIMGGGFGGCVVVLHDTSVDVTVPGHRSWRVRPSMGGVRRLAD